VAETQWRIHDATYDDLPAVAALIAEAPLLRRYATSHQQALELLRQAHAEGDVLLVLRAAAAPAAAGLAWVIFTRAFDHAAYLRLLLVAEGSQGAGAGHQLMLAVEERARAQARHLFFMVTCDNTAARRFYERLGFRAVGVLPGHVRPDVDEVLYHKPLAARV
jgi:ribosomal protein S18 acetylase RimI-like enzyme